MNPKTAKLNELKEIEKFLGIKPIKEINLNELKGVISPLERLKKIFSAFLPEILPELIKRDLTYFFLYKYLKGEEKRKILSEWCDISHSSFDDPSKITVKFEDGSAYRAVFDFLFWDKATEGNFLNQLMKRFSTLQMYHQKLTTREIIEYMNILFSSIRKIPLDHIDVEIISTLTAKPLINAKELANTLGLSRNTVNKHLRKLEERCFLTINSKINYELLGLTNVIVVSWTPIPVLPYMKISQELRAGSTLYTYSFLIPNDKIQSFSYLFDKSRIKGEFWIVTNRRFFMSIKKSYNPDKRVWNIEWENWALWLKRMIKEGWYTIYSTGEEEYENITDVRRRIFFDVTDLILLNYLVYNCKMPLRKLAKALNISVSQTYERKKRLRELKVYQPFVYLTNIGLDETVCIQVKGSEDILRSIEAALLDLPQTYIYWLRNLLGEKCLIAFCMLPKGSISMIDYILRTYLTDLPQVEALKLFYRIKQNYVGLDIPMYYNNQCLYNEDSGWIWLAKEFKEKFAEVRRTIMYKK
ncbi:MAG: winged helix-turn-helix domain-containing protein [Candidatus Odinarchaeia archaeon]